MPSKAFEGTVDYLQVLDENGIANASLIPPELDDAKLTEMLKYMIFTRALDAKMLSLQRQGIVTTYAPLVGEEATQIGSAMAMRKQDFFVPTFRQHGVFLVRGYPLDQFFIYWRGFEDGSKRPEEVNGACVAVPVATQMPHATGMAFALKYTGRDAAVISYVGDGGTSEGDFYEALNFAGVWKAPLVAVIENNQWAISVPRSRQTAALTLAQKGIAVGIRCVQVDGNDVIAVYKATKEAIENAKDGPTLIECVTYRMSMHTTADDPTRYRTDADVAEWAKKDPIDRLRKYLVGKGVWNDSAEQQLADGQRDLINQALESAKTFKPDPKGVFDTVYSYMPGTLKEEFDDAVSSDFWQ
jgi:pyruvate dehydrogenase E1 component alpha subunit